MIGDLKTRGLVSITAYDEDGNEVSDISAQAVYEVWVFNLSLKEGDFIVKAKFDMNWENAGYQFNVRYDLSHGEIKVSEVTQTDSQISFKVDGTALKLRVVNPLGDTRTFNREHPNVTIKAYNAEGTEVAVGSAEASYEIWSVDMTLDAGDYSAEVKYYADGSSQWNTEGYAFTIK